MSKRRRGRSGPVAPVPGPVPVLELRDFELYSDDTGATATVFGEELRDLIGRLARANGFEESELLANVSIPAGEPLPCRIIEHLPAGCSWIADGSGYILAKLGRGRTVRGHSFLGDGGSESADQSYRGVAGLATTVLNEGVSSPPPPLHSTTPRAWLAGWPLHKPRHSGLRGGGSLSACPDPSPSGCSSRGFSDP